MIKAAIFDLDGTLIDSMGYWTNVDKEFLTSRNIKQSDNIFTDIEGGNSFLEVARHFKDRFQLSETIPEIIKEWTLLVAKHYKEDITLKPGAREFLDRLKAQGIKLGVGTSNSLELATLALQGNGIFDYFDAIVTGCIDIKGKPFPDIFLEVAAKLNVQPETCFVCEDTLVGIKAAKKAQMHTIAVYDKHSAAEMEAIKTEADYFGMDFNQILDYCLKKEILR